MENAPIYGEAIAGRSSQVRKQLEGIKSQIDSMGLDEAELLLEAQENNYFAQWETTLDDYVNTNLGIKPREAKYRMAVVRGSRALGYERSDLEFVGISKLKQIYRLDVEGTYYNPETQKNEKLSDHIHRLMTMAEQGTGLAAIEAEVRRLKGQVGDNEETWANFRVTRSVKDNVITPGLNAFRKYLGSKNVKDENGSTEYSDSFVLECVFAEVLAGSESVEEITDEVENDSDEN